MRALCLLVLASGCLPGDEAPTGLGYIHSTRIEGACPIVKAASDFPAPCDPLPPAGTVCGLDQLVNLSLPYESARTVVSLNGASAYAGGNLLVVAWQAEDRSIPRFYLDIGPARGLGALIFPYVLDPRYEQSIGYTEWRDGVRTFTARRMFAGMTWLPGILGGDDPARTIEAHAAFEGVDEAGAVACRIIGLYAETDHARDAYDPAWLEPNATVMFGLAGEPPTYADDHAATASVVAPSAAGPDPGGAAPPIITYLPAICGLGHPCGGGGGCGG